MTYTPEEIKKMPLEELIQLIEKKVGRQLPISEEIFLAMCHGERDRKINIIDLDHPERSGDQGIDYEKLAELLNKPDAEWIRPYTGPKLIIRDPAHFVDTILFALEQSLKIESDLEEKPIHSLMNCFDHLLRVAKNYERTGYHYKISPDISEHSFYFICYDAEERIMYNGGIIMHKREGRCYWSIHT